MTTADEGVLQATMADATTALAGRVLNAIHGDAEVGLADFVESSMDATAAMGAVRVLGADAFAGNVLHRCPLKPDDAIVVDESFAVFPPAISPDTPDQWVAAWRDWATVRLAGHLAGSELTATRHVTVPPATATALLGDATAWQRWSIRAAQLSPLALADLAGPVTAIVAGEPHALARGVSRAILRRDHGTAARLARWVALLASMDLRLPVDPVLLVEHLRLHAGAGPRLLVDLAMARHLLGLVPACPPR